MFEIAGLSMVLIALIAVLALGVLTALHVRRISAQAVRLRSHPLLDPEWRTRKSAVFASLGENAQRMRDIGPRLAAASAAIARDLDALAASVFTTAGSVENILQATAPWLRGLFAGDSG